MRKTILSLLAAFGIITFLLTTSGCSHKAPKTEDNGIHSAMDDSDMGTSDQGKAYGMKTVFFAYDTNLLSNDAKEQLKQNAEILKAHPSVKIQIEGNCDERGGIQYNLALGDKRATAVKHFLHGLGIDDSRMATVSFGKEHPIAMGDTEEAYAKNRRANFAITSK